MDAEMINTSSKYPPISIRYEGGDASRKQIDLNQLGESLQGFARIIAISANLLETGKIGRHLNALSVKVIAVPVEEHRCFEVLAVVQEIVSSKEFWAGFAPGALAVITQFILSRRGAEEMKYLRDALTKQMELSAQGNESTIDKLVATIHRLSEAMIPSAKKAMAPIGRSCKSIDLYSGDSRFHHIDASLKADIENGTQTFSDHSKHYQGIITELDMKTGACRITLDGEDDRMSGQILDPVYSQPANPYAEAMAAGATISVLGKAELNQDGDIIKIYILDTAGQA